MGEASIIRKPTARSGWWNVAFGLWLLVSPVAFNVERAAAVHQAAAGVALAVLAWGHRTKGRTRTGLDVLIGIWLIAAPFVLRFEDPFAVWNSIAVGSAIVLINGTARPVHDRPPDHPPSDEL